MPVSGEVYKQIGRNAAGPVCIAAAYDRATGAVVGLTASSFVTLSFEPPMVMFAIQQHADSYASIVSSKAFGVSLLGRGQSQIASLFATKGREKIERTPFIVGGTLQVPLIRDSLAEIECLTSQVFVSGDHALSWDLLRLRARARGIRFCISAAGSGLSHRCLRPIPRGSLGGCRRLQCDRTIGLSGEGDPYVLPRIDQQLLVAER